MNGRVSRSLRRVGHVNRKKDGDRKYYHYNAQKAAKKKPADSSDPIISDTKRQTYQAIKTTYRAITLDNVKASIGQKLQYIRSLMSNTAKEMLDAKGNA